VSLNVCKFYLFNNQFKVTRCIFVYRALNNAKEVFKNW